MNSMIILFTHYIYEKLNRVKNISLYDLSTDFNTRAEGCDIKMKYNDLRPCDVYVKTLTSFFINTRYL